MSQPRPSRWQPLNPSLKEMMASALTRALVLAWIVSMIFFGVRLLQILASPVEGGLLHLFGDAGKVFFVVWVLLFPTFLIAGSRVLSDGAFTVAGFLATFFGLGILTIFFVSLGEDVVEWFHYTPSLVQRQNAKIEAELAQVAEFKQAQAQVRDELATKLAAAIKERDDALSTATTEEDKKDIRELTEFGIARLQSDLEKTQAEKRTISQGSLRPDVSRSGVFVAFLTNTPSSLPQDAGIAPALLGSIWLGLITLLFAVPVGVGAAIYLEEYRQEGLLARIIQININNLAGVPSVVYGILGGFVFVWLFHKLEKVHPGITPRNLLGGGLTLGLLTLPIVIVSAQEAIRAVPSSLRQGAYALGATKWQVIWTIVLPMARPGILTGTILSLSRAIGEAAPLVLFGSQLFVDQMPSLFSRFTALPLQIFNWCDRPPYLVPGQEGEPPIDIWKYNAAVASCVLLTVLLGINAIAIFLRNRAQRKARY